MGYSLNVESDTNSATSSHPLCRHRVMEALKRKHMRQKDLAKSTGLTEVTISRYLRGVRIPSGENLLKIARALNLTTDYLLGMEQGNNVDLAYKEVRDRIVRNASNWSPEQKAVLANMLLDLD